MPDGPGTLKALFIYPNMIATSPKAIQALCPQPASQALAPVAIATEIAIGAAVKAVESIVDAAAAKTHADATILDATFPLAGFFDGTGSLAVSGGCLIFHNAVNDDLSDATLVGSFVLTPSFDFSAFRFTVHHWQFTRFLQSNSSKWFQKNRTRDFILKIEFLSPGSAGLGTRSVYVEYAFLAVDAATLRTAFWPGQELAWFAVPQRPTSLPIAPTSTHAGRYLPLNIRVTTVETTQPNQIARWLQDVAKEKKADVSLVVKDALQKALDQNYAAADSAKQAELAATAYTAYKTSWDDAATQLAAKPKAPSGTPNQQEIDQFEVATQAWRAGMIVKTQLLAARRTLARAAFESAGLRWPSELPVIAAV